MLTSRQEDLDRTSTVVHTLRTDTLIPLDCFMLPDTHPLVLTELARLRDMKHTLSTKTKKPKALQADAKWVSGAITNLSQTSVLAPAHAVRKWDRM